MTRAKKTLLGLLIVVLLLVPVAYFVGNYLLSAYSQKAMSAIANRGKKHGVVIEEPNFEQAKIAGIRTARWTDLRARLRFPDNEAFDPNRTFDVHVGQVELWLSGSGEVTLEAGDITVNSVAAAAHNQEPPAAGDPRGERIEAQRFRCQFQMELFNPLPGLVDVLPELVGLMKAGATQIPVVTEGVLEFSLKGTNVKARIQVARVEGGQTLVLAEDDLRSVSALFDEGLTDAEIGLISTYPLRAAQLLRVKNDSESSAKSAHQRDQGVPQDAYRHVLWSFLLTNKYGVDVCAASDRCPRRGRHGQHASRAGNGLSQQRDWSSLRRGEDSAAADSLSFGKRRQRDSRASVSCGILAGPGSETNRLSGQVGGYGAPYSS